MQVLKELLDSNITRTLLAILAVCVSITTYVLNRKQRGITYWTSARTAISRVDHAPEVQIMVDGKPVASVWLVLINFENTGNDAIKAEDFVKPVSFSFEVPGLIISSKSVDERPAGIDASVSFDASTVTLKPMLMNPGDRVVLQVLLRGFPGDIRAQARVLGIRALKHRRGTPRLSPDVLLIIAIGVCVCIVVDFYWKLPIQAVLAIAAGGLAYMSFPALPSVIHELKEEMRDKRKLKQKTFHKG
jgi:hypothetical protein